MTINILCIHVETRGIVTEEFLPEPAMGNMRQDNPEYAKKYAEKQARAREEAEQDPALAIPRSVEFCHVRVVDGDERRALEPQDTFTQAKHAWENRAVLHGALEQLPLGGAGVVLIGIHPTTHHKILVNSFIRAGLPVPYPLRVGVARCYNPWRELGFAHEFPVTAKLLGLPTTNPVQATMDLVIATGVPGA